MSPSATQIYLQRSFSRRDYLQLIQTAYTFQEYSFAAQVALDWLTDFPGDLPVRYFYGVARLKAGQASLGIAILDQVLQLDPEFTEALQARLEIEIQVDRGAIKLAPSSHRSSYSLADYREWLNALQGYRPGSVKHPYPSLEMRWGEELYRIRKSLEVSSALEDELFAREVQNQLKPLLARKSAHPLVAITHVRSLYLSYKAGRHPLPALRQVVAHYRHTFPRCLYFAYVAVEISMENGEQDQAVALLHSLAAQDLTAQVFQRLWSPEHPFLEIWPKNLEKRLDVPIPARIATIFGWNRLPEPGNEWERRAVDQPTEQAEEGVVSALSQKSNGHSRPPVEPPYLKKDHLDLDPPTRSLVEAVPSPLAEELRKVQEVFNQLAMRLKQPHLQYLDGRRPVYVALTNKSQLGRYFPPEKVCQVQEAILELLSAIQESQGWQGLLYNVDEGLTLSLRNQTVHIAPVSQNDPWAIKRSLHQLDQLLAKRGEMIGAVLIVGPHEVIPFHRLPNPLEDGDPEVYSDNPYGARDENYFVMDWPVGRLPCSVEHPEDWLGVLKNLTLPYRSKSAPPRVQSYPKSLAFLWSWLRYLLSLFQPTSYTFSSFGYTAAAWRLASFAVFRQIGDPRSMLISPQLIKKLSSAEAAKQRLVRHAKVIGVLEEARVEASAATRGLTRTEQVTLPCATAGYFNLHGLADSPEWFGQSDPSEGEGNLVATSDHPIALQPGDLLLNPKARIEFVFTEACFGAHTFGKDVSTSIALAFLQKGCRAFVGSTCTSYGSNATPLLAADLLAYEFWKFLRQGLPAGEALRQAKLKMAQELTSAYGHLDGEDQKTLTSFVLYGDPLAQVHPVKLSPQVLRHSKTAAVALRSTCDHAYQARPEELTPQLESLVKKLVAQHLPGMEFSKIEVLSEKQPQQICPLCHPEEGKAARCTPAEQAKGKQPQVRKIIILTRQERRKEHLYTQYARLTLDERGRLIKLTLSR